MASVRLALLMAMDHDAKALCHRLRPERAGFASGARFLRERPRSLDRRDRCRHRAALHHELHRCGGSVASLRTPRSMPDFCERRLERAQPSDMAQTRVSLADVNGDTRLWQPTPPVNIDAARRRPVATALALTHTHVEGRPPQRLEARRGC